MRQRPDVPSDALVVAADDPAAGFWPAVGYDHDQRIARHVRMLPPSG